VRLNRTIISIAVIAAILMSYFATCMYIKMKRQAAYDSVKVGDTADSVILRFGDPSVREGQEKLFSRYASSRCQSPCVERLWFENRLALDIEAWSVSLGSDGKVIEKYHWVSP
jgi:hypothetical protein